MDHDWLERDVRRFGGSATVSPPALSLIVTLRMAGFPTTLAPPCGALYGALVIWGVADRLRADLTVNTLG